MSQSLGLDSDDWHMDQGQRERRSDTVDGIDSRCTEYTQLSKNPSRRES